MASEEFVMRFNEEVVRSAAGSTMSKKWSQKGKSDPGGSSLDTMTVRLGDEYIVLARGTLTRVFDFRTRRILESDLESGRTTNRSLFSEIGYRSSEMANRVHCSQVLEAGGLAPEDNPFGNLFRLESLFGICGSEQDAERAQNSVIRETTDDKNLFRCDGETIVTHSSSDQLIPDQYQNGYRKFLLLGTRMHPAIRLEVEQSKNVFASLSFDAWNIERESTTLQLESVAIESSQRPETAFDYDAHLDRETRMGAIIYRAMTEACDATGPEPLAFVKDCIERENYLDAMLGFLERELTVGDGANEVVKQIAPHAQSDTQLGLFLLSMQLGDEEACRRSMQALSQIDRTQITKQHMLDLFEGQNMRVRRPSLPAEEQPSNGAQAKLLDALAVNPHITGVYKDMGDDLFHAFRPNEAWLCWDTGRHLFPDHPILNDVKGLESTLESRHPEFVKWEI